MQYHVSPRDCSRAVVLCTEMCSQVVESSSSIEVLEINSFIRGYHAYKDLWSPVIGESLLVKREPTNSHDVNAVAVYKEAVVVGHVPYNLAQTFSHFLKRDVNKAFAEVTGTKVNRGAGYGLEVPCKYKIYGSKPYIDKIKVIIDRLVSSGLI